MKERNSKQVNFYLSHQLGEAVNLHISSRHLNRSAWMRAIVRKNLIGEGVMDKDGNILEPWLSEGAKRGLTVTKNSKSGEKKNEDYHYNFCLPELMFTALNNYAHAHPTHKSRQGAMAFWILTELVDAGQISLRSNLGKAVRQKVAA